MSFSPKREKRERGKAFRKSRRLLLVPHCCVSGACCSIGRIRQEWGMPRAVSSSIAAPLLLFLQSTAAPASDPLAAVQRMLEKRGTCVSLVSFDRKVRSFLPPPLSYLSDAAVTKSCQGNDRSSLSFSISRCLQGMLISENMDVNTQG